MVLYQRGILLKTVVSHTGVLIQQKSVSLLHLVVDYLSVEHQNKHDFGRLQVSLKLNPIRVPRVVQTVSNK